MRFFRALLSATLVSGLAIVSWPKTGQCAMGFSSATACRMPCCRKSPVPSCPMVKPQAPRDMIVTSSPVPARAVLKVLYVILSATTPEPMLPRWEWTPVVEALRDVFLPPPLLGRAPPAFTLRLFA